MENRAYRARAEKSGWREREWEREREGERKDDGCLDQCVDVEVIKINCIQDIFWRCVWWWVRGGVWVCCWWRIRFNRGKTLGMYMLYVGIWWSEHEYKRNDCNDWTWSCTERDVGTWNEVRESEKVVESMNCWFWFGQRSLETGF